MTTSVKQFQLDNLSYVDLVMHSKDVQAAIRRARDREVSDVRTQVQKIAEQHGLTLSELVQPRKRRIAAPKARKAPAILTPRYINPRNPNQTWSGRGRRPHWFTSDLGATGKKSSPRPMATVNA